MKLKTLLLFCLTLLVALIGAHSALAQQGTYVPLAPIPGLTEGAVPTSSGTAAFLNNLYKYLIGLAAALAVIEIIWGGIEWSTQDSVSKKGQGRHRITQAIIGLILVLSPALVFYIINPSILNLSVNFSALNTPTGTWTPSTTSSGSSVGSTDSATGCTVTGTLFKQASCPSQQAAQDFAASCSGQVLSCQTENSSGCADTTFRATCSTTQGPYVFIDTSQSGFSFYGIVNAIIGYSHYEPLAQTPTDQNNGNEIVQFSNTCVGDGGVVCLSNSVLSTSCSYNSAQSTSQSNTCYSKSMTCTSSDSSFYSTSACSSNPQFTIIQ